jgi:hypothetical protein
LDQLREGVNKVPVDPSLLIPSQAPSVLSIIGDQGVGKSTTLKYACDRLVGDESRIVTPVVSPERFADGDTLFGWVLAALTQLIPRRIPSASRQVIDGYMEGNLRLLELAHLLRRQEALARKSNGIPSVALGSHPDELAENVAAITTAGQQLVAGWVALLNSLLENVTQIVVPVDDADQVPSQLVTILRDLRWMTVHPLVTVVVCVNQDMLMQSLLGEEDLNVMDLAARRRHAMGALTKALPQHLRLKLDRLTAREERLAFKPPSEKRSLIDVLRSFKNPEAGSVDPKTIADLFELQIGSSTVTCPYAEVLPETPRQLDQLWRELQGIAVDPDQSPREKTATATQRIAERGIEVASERFPDLPETLRFFEAGLDHRLSVELNFREVEATNLKGAARAVLTTDKQRVAIRRIEEMPMYIRDDSVDDSSVPQRRLPRAFANAHYFALDSAAPEGDSLPLHLWAIAGSLGVPGGQAWQGTLEVLVDTERTDDLFALVPIWDSRYDYALYQGAWNQLWNTLHSLAPRPSPKLLEWIIMRHVRLVAEIQATRRISPDLVETAGQELEDLSHWSAESDAEVFCEMARDLYDGSQDAPVRQRDFDGWIEHYLPWVADPVLAAPGTSKLLLQARSEILEDHGTLERANRACADRLSGRIQRHLSADWVIYTIDLLAKFDQAMAENLTSLHQVAGEHKDREVEALSHALESRGVPREIVGEIFVAGVTPKVEQELRLAGFPDAAIDTLSQRFAPISEEVPAESTAEDRRLPPPNR